MRVCKFGGSSLAATDRITQVADILEMDDSRRCAVLSAPGKSPKNTVKVTDLLIKAVDNALSGRDYSKTLKEVIGIFSDIYLKLGVEEDSINRIRQELESRMDSPMDDKGRYRDSIVSCGELFNAELFTEYLGKRGISAEFITPEKINLVVSDNYGDALPLEKGVENLKNIRMYAEKGLVIFPGFYGVTEQGETATFSRGGSDLTGALLSEAVSAEVYENWTDVNGIFSASPKIVTEPEQIPALTYRELRELSYMGFNVFHEEAVQPVIKKKIPIRLRNTNNVGNTGTLIVSERLPSERDVIGVASSPGFCSITIQKFLMNRETGFGKRFLEILTQNNISYEHCPSGVDNMSVIMSQDQLGPETMNELVREIGDKLNPDDIKTEFGISLIAVVGEGLLHKIGVLANAAMSLSKAGVNIKLVNQGSSEMSMIFGIDASEEKKAVQALYTTFFE